MYVTKQCRAVLACFESLGGSHATVQTIAEMMRERGEKIGLSTIYRNIERLETLGKVRKYSTYSDDGACYQLIVDTCDIHHFHLKCETCGKLTHLCCAELDTLQGHVADEHAFRINPAKTVFYGTCADCQGEGDVRRALPSGR